MTKAENIRNQCMKILDKYDADYRGVTVDRIDGTTYVIFKYYGGTNDTVDRNDDSWDEMFELDGVVDVGYGEGYGIKGKYEDSLLIELDEDIVESKKSARKSIKEERYNVELSDYSGSIVDEDTFDKKSDAIQWANDNGRNCYARIWDNEEGKTVKEWKVKSIKESADDNWYKLKMLNEMLDAMEEDEYNIPKLGIYGVTKNINLDKGAIEALIKYYK